MINKCFRFYGVVKNHVDNKVEQKTKCIAPKRILFTAKNELRDQALSNVITTLKGKFFAYEKGYSYSKGPLKVKFRCLK